MISRAFEWYQIVNPNPTSQTVDNRVASIREFIKVTDSAESYDFLLSCASGVVAGFDPQTMSNWTAVTSLVSCIRAHESAFPEDLSENAVELRACSAIALGEIITRNQEQGVAPDSLLAASVLRSALSIRPKPPGKYLTRMLEELDAESQKALDKEGRARRNHLVNFQPVDKLKEQTEFAAAWKALIPALKTMVEGISQSSAIDREELNVLWWMFAVFSNIAKDQIAALPQGAAALCCGAELATMCLVPPVLSLEGMVRRAYGEGRAVGKKAKLTISQIAADWTEELQGALVPTEKSKMVSRSFPHLLPLSWLCDRLIASHGAKGWQDEFTGATGISPDLEVHPRTAQFRSSESGLLNAFTLTLLRTNSWRMGNAPNLAVRSRTQASACSLTAC